MKHVLIIDDDELLRKAWVRYFKTCIWNWEVSTAATVGEAVLALCAPGHEYDLIISDFDLQDPEGDGVDVLVLARGEQPGARRIMCSGSQPTLPRIKNALTFGTVECFASKPFDVEMLNSKIGELLNKTDNRGEN